MNDSLDGINFETEKLFNKITTLGTIAIKNRRGNGTE